MTENVEIQPVGSDEAALRARARDLTSAVYWHHSMRLFPEITVQGGKSAETLELERACILGPLDLRNRTVLDIGSWNGYFAFEAKRQGASQVIASDSYTWTSPLLRGRETFELARACLGLDVQAVEIDPTELPGNLAPCDVVLFLGVFYHLFDPIDVLGRAAALAKDVLVVETHEDLKNINRPAMAFYPRATLNGDPTNWWGPNPECLVDLLEANGFTKIFYQQHPLATTRGVYHAFRTAEAADAYLTRKADNRALFDLSSQEGRRGVFGKSPAEGGLRAALVQLWDALWASIKFRLSGGRPRVAVGDVGKTGRMP